MPRIEIQTRQHPRAGWILVPIRVADDVRIEMVLNLGVPRSSISTAVRDSLIMRELVPPRLERAYVLADVTADDQPLPPLQVRVSGALRLIGAAGILGLDFFTRFEDVHLHVPSLRLTLSGS